MTVYLVTEGTEEHDEYGGGIIHVPTSYVYLDAVLARRHARFEPWGEVLELEISNELPQHILSMEAI